jgi:hypothetical protein
MRTERSLRRGKIQAASGGYAFHPIFCFLSSISLNAQDTSDPAQGQRCANMMFVQRTLKAAIILARSRRRR